MTSVPMAVGSPEWQNLLQGVKGWLVRRIPSWHVDDIVSEVQLVLVERFADQKPTRSWSGMAFQVARGAVRRARRDADRMVVDGRAFDELPVCAAEPAPQCAQVFDVATLRGSRERAVAGGVLAGEACAEIARRLGIDVKEAYRLANDLAAKLGRSGILGRTPTLEH